MQNFSFVSDNPEFEQGYSDDSRSRSFKMKATEKEGDSNPSETVFSINCHQKGNLKF